MVTMNGFDSRKDMEKILAMESSNMLKDGQLIKKSTEDEKEKWSMKSVNE